MNRKLEQKIEAEIRRRVLEKDRELEEKQKDTVQQATVEALAEMTALSRDEVDKIAQAVRQEFEIKRNKRVKMMNTITIIFGAMALIIGFRSLLNQLERPQTITLIETFDSSERGWTVGEFFDHRYFIQDGEYVLEHVKDGWCNWDYVPVNFPADFSVEVTSTWKKGKYDEYGIMLTQDNSNYYSFQLRGDGTASYSAHINKEWKVNANWIKNKARIGDGQNSNLQRLEVYTNPQDKSRVFKYFINAVLFSQGYLKDLSVKNLALSCCGAQTVTFDQIKIVDLNTEEVLLEESFDPPLPTWKPDTSLSRTFTFSDGQYVVTGFVEEMCYWSNIPAVLAGDYEIVLDSYRMKGEEKYFGLMLINDDKNYFAYEVKQDGTARFVWNHNGTYEKISDAKSGLVNLSPDNHFQQKVIIKDKKFEYFVNDHFIDSWDLQAMPINKVGIRVCGRQTVAFDNLTIRPL